MISLIKVGVQEKLPPAPPEVSPSGSQMIFPPLSVVSLPPFVPTLVQFRVEMARPPPLTTRPFMVELAVVALILVVEIPPWKVEVAVEVEVMTPVIRLPIEVEAIYDWLAYRVPEEVALVPEKPPLKV